MIALNLIVLLASQITDNTIAGIKDYYTTSCMNALLLRHLTV